MSNLKGGEEDTKANEPKEDEVKKVYIKIGTQIFEFIDVEGDGKCLFHSLVLYKSDACNFANEEKLREYMVKKVEDDVRLKALFHRLFPEKTSFDKWKKGIMGDEWGDEKDIVLFGCMFKVNVVVHTINSHKLTTIDVRKLLNFYQAMEYGSLVPNKRPQFHLFHHVFSKPDSVPAHGENPNHFGVLTPMKCPPVSSKIFDPEGDDLFDPEGDDLFDPELGEPVYRQKRRPLDDLYVLIYRQQQMHRLAAAYFRCRHRLFLFYPSITITAIASILSFLSESTVVGKDVATVFSIIVGCLAIISVFLQTLASELGYHGKAEMHESVALDLRKMLGTLDIELLDTVSEADRLKEYETASSQTLIGCKSLLPLQITHAFDLIKSRFGTTPAFRYLAKQPQTRWPDIYTIVYDEIFAAIDGNPFFPSILPKAEAAVKVALKNLKTRWRVPAEYEKRRGET